MTTTEDLIDTREPAAAPNPWRGRIAFALVVTVLLAAVAAVAVLYSRQDAAERRSAARDEATQSAHRRLPELLSYGHDTLDRDLAAAQRSVTGPFAAEYGELQRTMVRPAALRDKITTRTTVSALGVVRADENEVVVLAFINQLTTSTRHTTPLIEGARIRVTLQHTGDEWLVSRMDTV